MKKSSFYRSTAAAVVAVMTAGALSFTSCETFDDSQIQSSLDDLNSRVETIEEQLAALQGDVDAINSLLADGKIIKSVTASEDGTSYTITYKDDQVTPDVITVGTADPVITIMDEDGVWYWAKIDAEGNPEHILGADNKLPVDNETGAPKFKISDDDKLQISIDGGTNWSDTGVAVSDIATFKSVVPDAKNGNVTFTFQDGTSFSVPMSTELVCEIVSGQLMFDLGETKNIQVNAGGYEDYEVDVPFGWTAEFDGSSISLTSPYTEDKEMSGELILRLYAGDRVKMDKIRISVGNLEFTVNTGIVNGKHSVIVNAPYKLAFYLGAMKLSEYSAEAAAEAVSTENEYETKETEDPESGTITVEPLVIPFSDIVENPEIGETYIIWTFDQEYSIEPENVYTYRYVYGMGVEAKVENITALDADISITPSANTSYYWGIYLERNFDAEGLTMLLNRGGYGSTSQTLNGKLSELSQSAQTAISIRPEEDYVLWIALDNHGEGGTFTASDIMVYDIPLAELDRTANPEIIKFGIVTATDSEVSAPFEVIGTPAVMYVDYISDEDYQNVYHSNDNEVREALVKSSHPFTDDTEFIAGEGGLEPDTKGWLVGVAIDENGALSSLAKIEANTAAAVSEDDYDPNISISPNWLSFEVEGNTARVDVKFEGQPDSLIYYFVDWDRLTEDYGGAMNGAANIKAEMDANPKSWRYNGVDDTGNTVLLYTEDGAGEKTYMDKYTIEVSDLAPGMYMLVATVVSVTAEGEGELRTDVYRTSETYAYGQFEIAGSISQGTLYEKSSDEWETSKPAINISYSGTPDFVTVTANITPGTGATEWYAATATTGGLIDDESDTEALIEAIKNAGPHTGAGSVADYLFGEGESVKLYVTWTDAAGNSYEPIIMNIPYQIPAE